MCPEATLAETDAIRATRGWQVTNRDFVSQQDSHRKLILRSTYLPLQLTPTRVVPVALETGVKRRPLRVIRLRLDSTPLCSMVRCRQCEKNLGCAMTSIRRSMQQSHGQCGTGSSDRNARVLLLDAPGTTMTAHVTAQRTKCAKWSQGHRALSNSVM